MQGDGWMKTDICKRCGVLFNKAFNAQKYCSIKCAKNIKEKATKKKDKICPKCGKAFQWYDFGKKYCSKECSPYVRNRKHICQYCGIEYKPKHTKNKYCSFECSRKAHTKNIFTCQNCGKEYHNTRGKKEGIKFCSRECAFDSLKKNARGDKHICKACGKEYFTKEFNSVFYCSEKCKIKSSIRKSFCIICGEEFTHSAYAKAKVCKNISCIREVYKIKSAKRRAQKLNNIVGEIDIKTIYMRDGFKCGICHKKVLMHKKFPHKKSPSIDHIIPITLGGSTTMNNLQLAHLSCNISKKNNIKNGVQQFLF